MTEIKTYNDLNEAIKNYRVKHEVESKTWWMLINYKNRVYFDESRQDPRNNKVVETLMIDKIMKKAKEWDQDEEYEKELKAKYNLNH